MTPDERREKDRVAHRKRYAVMKETISAKNLAHYYKRKEADPNFHPRPVGRPKKVSGAEDPVVVVDVDSPTGFSVATGSLPQGGSAGSD
jgi:hypothetical protein